MCGVLSHSYHGFYHHGLGDKLRRDVAGLSLLSLIIALTLIKA